jgi:hypothetical protein
MWTTRQYSRKSWAILLAMVPGSPSRVSAVLAALHPWRWWITLAGCAALVLDLLAFGGHQVLWALGWVLTFTFTLWFWGPIMKGWARGFRRAGKSFREGLGGQ